MARTRTPDELTDALAAVLRPLGKIAVACSGGVDSPVRVTAAAAVLGTDQVLAVTALTPMVPARKSRMHCGLAAWPGSISGG